MNEPTREDDELTLQVLDLHKKGHSYRAIARTTGLSKGAVAGRIVRVKRAEVNDATCPPQEHQK